MDTPRKRSRVWRWLRRGVLSLVAIIAVLAGIGFAYQSIATARDVRAYPPPGQMVDVGGGRRMHILCAGSGAPTVVLEAGLGGFSSDWVWVQEKVSPVTQVCAYDRAGSGWSDRGSLPRDAKAIAGDLKALLDAAGVAGPHVVVGHSYGGLYVRAFADAYPVEVAGLVLVDSSHEDQWTRPPDAPAQFSSIAQMYSIARIAARFGVVRVTNFIAVDPDLPAQQANERKARSDMATFIDTASDEFSATTATSVTVNAAGPLGDKPLFVVSAGFHDDTPGGEAEWQGFQTEFLATSTNSTRRLVKDATHMSLLTKQTDAEATAAAILAVVDAVRTGKRLVPAAQ